MLLQRAEMVLLYRSVVNGVHNSRTHKSRFNFFDVDLLFFWRLGSYAPPSFLFCVQLQLKHFNDFIRTHLSTYKLSLLKLFQLLSFYGTWPVEWFDSF